MGMPVVPEPTGRVAAFGGKLAERERDGFVFSLRPSLLTLPEIFRELGVARELVELDEPCRYRYLHRRA
ncbi:hypothetical protein ABZ914_01890 [Spirillospora sp. NPDC046719]